MNNKMVQSSSVMFNDSLMSTDDALTLLIDSAIVSTQTEISSLENFSATSKLKLYLNSFIISGFM